MAAGQSYLHVAVIAEPCARSAGAADFRLRPVVPVRGAPDMSDT
ncbi:MAG: hypothetical protein ACHQCE_07420 [Streptosporangiales bacterium]